MTPTNLVRWLLGLFTIYGALLGIGIGLGAAVPVENAVYKLAAVGMGVLSSEPLQREIDVSARGSSIEYDLRLTANGQTREARFEHSFHAQNMFLLWALGILTPGLAWTCRLRSLAIGTAIVLGLNVLISMGDLWVAEAIGFGIDTRAGANRGLSELGLLLRFLHPTGGAFMAPVFIWLLLFEIPKQEP